MTECDWCKEETAEIVQFWGNIVCPICFETYEMSCSTEHRVELFDMLKLSESITDTL